MFTKTTFALALVLATATGALAATKQQSSALPWQSSISASAPCGTKPRPSVSSAPATPPMVTAATTTPAATMRRPFILHPVALRMPDEPVVGAAAVFELLSAWRGQLQADRRLPAPVASRARAGDAGLAGEPR